MTSDQTSLWPQILASAISYIMRENSLCSGCFFPLVKVFFLYHFNAYEFLLLIYIYIFSLYEKKSLKLIFFPDVINLCHVTHHYLEVHVAYVKWRVILRQSLIDNVSMIDSIDCEYKIEVLN